MIRTKTFISRLNEVPREWVFEYYLTLPEGLSGQDIKIKSPFNPAEKNPSFFVYYSRTANCYKYKDFSTDRQGDGTSLVKELMNLKTRAEAANKIISDYNKFLGDNPDGYIKKPFQLQSKYKLKDFTPRHWNDIDAKYWTKYGIGSKILKKYRVTPLENYTITKTLPNGEVINKILKGFLMYGYFKKDNTLYKIYQPYVKDSKFFKVTDYIQGTDQLTLKKPNLVICSSLKDIMSLEAFNFKTIEAVAPSSENTPIPERIIEQYKLAYNICTLFDNDSAGIKSMKKYKDLYNIPSAHLELSKDLSDSVKDYGLNTTKIHLYPLLTKALLGKTKQL